MALVKLGDVAREYKATIKNAAGLPVVGLEHLTPRELILENWDSDVETTFTKGFKKGHILFGRRRAYLKKAAIAPFDGICSGDITVIEAIPEKINPDLLPFVIQNDALFDFAIGKSAGSLSPRVKWEQLKDYTFELPEMDKQQALVDILTAALQTKKAYQRQLAATDELVKSQFIEMFGTKETAPLSEFATICAGQSAPSDEEYSDTGTPFIKAGNLENLKLGIIEETDCYLVSEETIAKRKLKLQKAGSVLVAKSGMSCLSGHIYALKRDAYVVSHLACIRAKDDAYVEMVKWHFIITGTQGLIKNPSYPAIQIPQFENMHFPRASKAEAETFAAFAIQSDKSKLMMKNIILTGGKNMSHTFNEQNVEDMVIAAIQKNGWDYIPADQLPRAESDVMVESYVRDALIKFNPCIAEHPAHADTVIYKLRALISTVRPHDLVTQNERFKKLIFEENSFPFDKDGRSISIKFFDYDNPENNHFVVTNQWVYPQKVGGKRLDVVLLINGFPVAVGEMKSPVRPAISWMDGAGDILDYEKSIPEMFVTNILNFATEGKCFRYGSINAPVTLWGPWYAEIEHVEGDLAKVGKSVESITRKEVILDLFRYFTLFSTDKRNRKIKVVCRYQQYEGANLIVNRVKAGYPKKGLIWHFQGSGKSLLMVFAAQKLRMMKELNAPTVIIVNDRIDLAGQIFGTFSMADVPNLVPADTNAELIRMLKADTRKVIITKIFEFAKIDEAINFRDNIIVMVDEAHRTQEGDLGARMRMALPNAFFFGLTGTPINKLDKNTFATFGAAEDRTGYMSRYSFADSVSDKATLPLHFEPVPVKLHVDQVAIDEAFRELTDEMGLTEEERSKVAQRVRMAAIMKDPARIKAVCEHIADHFMTKVNPNGFKAQVVCFDRECCVLYKKELDRLLGEATSTIVMDTNNDKADEYKAWRRTRDEEARVLDDFRDPSNPLQIVIVTSKLLTGFDAPILQAMYLDKPMKDHTLLQAICRTNRIYGQDKSFGLIVDYVGIFDDVAKALSFDAESVEKIISNIEAVKASVPGLVEKCIGFFPGVDRTREGWEALVEAQDCLPTDEDKDAFGAHYRALNRVWNALSPDSCLNPFKADYKWLSKVYDSIRPTDERGKLIWAALGAKTIQLVHENISVESVDKDEDVLALDAEIIEKFISGDLDAGKKKRKIEIDLAAIIRKHPNDPRFIALGARMEKLREEHEAGLLTSMEFLKALLELAKDAAHMEREVVPEEEVDRGKAALTTLFQTVRNDATPVIVERIVNDIDGIVKIVRFPGWQDTPTGRKTVSKNLRDVIMRKYRIRDNEVFAKAYSYVEQYY